MIGRQTKAILLATLLLAVAAGPAAAHHVMGRMPQTFAEGLLSGLGHPIIGFDHLAAVVAVGGLAALRPRGAWLAVGYVVAMIAGVALFVAGVGLPAGEILVALSVVVLGVVLARTPPASLAIVGALFVLAGLIHGNALGESIVGAERATLAAYLIGLAAVQIALALAVMVAARWLMQQRRPGMALRLAGAGIAGIGVAIFAQQVMPGAPPL